MCHLRYPQKHFLHYGRQKYRSCVIIAGSQKGKTGQPGDGQDHEDIGAVPHEILFTQPVACPMMYHGVVSMGQLHQNEGSTV
jgi:hypothetical protein